MKLELEARELLAAAEEQAGYVMAADRLREGRLLRSDRTALAALTTALNLRDEAKKELIIYRWNTRHVDELIAEARSLALKEAARVADIVIETAIAGLIGFAHGAGLDEQQRSDGATALRAYLVETKEAAIRALGKDES